MMPSIGLTLLSMASVAITCLASPASFNRLSRGWFPRIRIPKKQNNFSKSNILLPQQLRGGDTDEERYSRQVYTLGARAHGLVRSSTIFIDGPATSGLVYECAKNLALSGVGNIVILTSESDDEVESIYHNADLDDLGRVYQRAAREEIGHDQPENDETVLMEYIKRLNPSVGVSIARRSDISVEQQRGVLLCIDRPHSTQVLLNNKCREENVAFVTVETAGVFGRTFCDFGPSFEVFDADGETPLVVPLDHVELIQDNLIQVHCVEGEKHDVSKGDQIQFQLVSGETMPQQCIVAQVESPRRFTIRCEGRDASLQEIVEHVNEQVTSFTRIKIPENVEFVPLEKASSLAKEDDSLFTPCDLEKSFDPIRRSTLFACFQHIQDFVNEHKRLPSKTDADEFEALVRNELSKDIAGASFTKILCQSFAKSCAGKLTPIQAILGAIGAQEALKAASGLYSPIRQFLLYDCDELLIDEDDDESDSCTTGQSYILGQRLCDKLANKRIFTVGAGAIGCELLKNLSAMGAAVGKGRIVVTDMDTIEKSNLSRQLLFRDADIGKFKSTAAHEAIMRFNPDVRVEVHTSKVGDEEHGPFSDAFWSKRVDVVLNALDNMEARLYMDGQCVAHQKSLIDAGTLGPKGNVQVVIPHKSESYGSSVDPPEPAIPVCTLKNFPYAIAHTIQWGRDLFDGCFQRRPKQANDFVSSFLSSGVDKFSHSLVNDLGEEQAQEAAKELSQDWAIGSENDNVDSTAVRDACIQWAAEYAKELFHDSIEALLRQHPVDSLDEEGEPFWSGTRRTPKALEYIDTDEVDSQQTAINTNLVDFVRYAARLRIEMFLSVNSSAEESTVSADEAVRALQKVRAKDSPQVDENQSTHENIAECLNAITPSEKTSLRAVEFEKDDENNGHVAFVTAASNLRALCYGIAPVDAMETRRVAGKIVPAMISTTAFVSALSCVELLKLLQGAPLEKHRNAFINLALPFFAYTAPMPAEEIEGLQGTAYTLWDRVKIKEGEKAAAKGGITVGKFLKRVAKKAGADLDISVSTVNFGPYMIYANFLHEEDEDLLSQSIWEVIKDAILSGDDDEFAGRDEEPRLSSESQLEVLSRRSFVDFTVVVEDNETGEEAELPPVRLFRHR